MLNIFRSMNIHSPKESVIFILAIVFFFITTNGCSMYSLIAPTRWAFVGQLDSVPETNNYGELTIDRNASNIFIIIDGKAVFRNDPNLFRSTFRLSPGDHEIEAMCLFSTFTRGILPTTVKIEEGKSKTIHFMCVSSDFKMYK